MIFALSSIQASCSKMSIYSSFLGIGCVCVWCVCVGGGGGGLQICKLGKKSVAVIKSMETNCKL